MQIRNGKLPRARQLARSGQQASREACLRLRWMDFYLTHRRHAALTCRHFGISRQTFYRWWRRYDPHELTTLESRSHRPHRRRQPTWTPDRAEQVLQLRRQYPRGGKDKLAVLLRRAGPRVSTSMVGRILTRLQQRGVLVEPPRVAVSRRAPEGSLHRLHSSRVEMLPTSQPAGLGTWIAAEFPRANSSSSVSASCRSFFRRRTNLPMKRISPMGTTRKLFLDNKGG